MMGNKVLLIHRISFVCTFTLFDSFTIFSFYAIKVLGKINSREREDRTDLKFAPSKVAWFDVIDDVAEMASIHSRKFRKLLDGKFIYIWTAGLRDSLVRDPGVSSVVWRDRLATILCEVSRAYAYLLYSECPYVKRA